MISRHSYHGYVEGHEMLLQYNYIHGTCRPLTSDDTNQVCISIIRLSEFLVITAIGMGHNNVTLPVEVNLA